MSTKVLFRDQHKPLHFLYGHNDCCLCNAENKIKNLEDRNNNLRMVLKNVLFQLNNKEMKEYILDYIEKTLKLDESLYSETDKI
jgi:hypothetical protein